MFYIFIRPCSYLCKLCTGGGKSRVQQEYGYMRLLLPFDSQSEVIVYSSGCVEWTVYVGRTSSGYVQQSDYSQSASACQNYCVQKSDCLAVEYVSSSSSSSRQCRVHTNGNNLNTRNEVIDVTQYRLSRTCGDSDSSNSRPQLIQGLCYVALCGLRGPGPKTSPGIDSIRLLAVAEGHRRRL